MKMEFLRSMAVGIVVWALVVRVEVRGLPPCDFPAIYNFGDSNSDTGGISAAFDPIPQPYGLNYFRKPVGRDCDGRLIIDFIGGSTIRRPNETIFEYGISPFSLDMQIVQYDQFKSRTHDLYSKDPKLPKPEDFSKALYTFDIGQNDLSVGFRKLSNEQLRAAIPDIVNQLASAVQHLYEKGARTFWIHNTGPIGCLPVGTFYILNPQPGFLDQYGCIKGQNDMAVEFNKQLKDRVNKLRTELPDAALTYVDVYAAKYGLISNTKSQGFTDPIKVCCGHHENYDHVWCGQKASINGTEIYGASCTTPSTYISWDGVHYSEAANHWVANHILNGSLSEPPVPITHACYKQPGL